MVDDDDDEEEEESGLNLRQVQQCGENPTICVPGGKRCRAMVVLVVVKTSSVWLICERDEVLL